jgi:hypothetical protein
MGKKGNAVDDISSARNETTSTPVILLLLPPVSDEEVNEMIAALLSFKEKGECYDREWSDEVRRLSVEWIRAVMSQPYKNKNTQKRRPNTLRRN